eukprot:561568-Rhodomonas_salina.1
MLGSQAGVDGRREPQVEPPQPTMADILEKLSAAWMDGWSLGSVTKERLVHLFTAVSYTHLRAHETEADL